MARRTHYAGMFNEDILVMKMREMMYFLNALVCDRDVNYRTVHGRHDSMLSQIEFAVGIGGPFLR